MIYLWSGLGLLFEQMGCIANLASYMYVTLCKTASDVDIMHSYRYRFGGGPIATQCFVHFPDTRELSLYYIRLYKYITVYISSIPEF